MHMEQEHTKYQVFYISHVVIINSDVAGTAVGADEVTGTFPPSSFKVLLTKLFTHFPGHEVEV